LTDEKLVNGARVARELGISRSAVSNWHKRGSLPEHLRPMDNGPGFVPLWPKSKLPELREWYGSQKGRRGKASPRRPRGDSLEKLLEYVMVAKKAAAVKGHLGFEDGNFEMGKAAAYQDIENLIKRKLSVGGNAS
jgi:hypothetical protein